MPSGLSCTTPAPPGQAGGTAITGPNPERLEDIRRLLDDLRAEFGHAVLALEEEPAVVAARGARDRAAAAIDGHLLPRLSDLDSPIVIVVAGSTGSGKSTTVNSIAGSEISAAGARRPTTTSPIVVCHPDHLEWFRARDFLGLGESTGGPPVAVVPSEALPDGLALIDSPDIDSVAAGNRETADRLLAAADLWLWVSTPRRYGDKRPLDYLRRAGATGRPVAILVNKLTDADRDEVLALARERLADVGLGDATVFTARQGLADGDLLHPDDVTPMRRWIGDLSSPEARRAAVARALSAGLRATAREAESLLAGLTAERRAIDRLGAAADQAYAAATRSIEESLADGSLLRGEVVRQMPDALGTGAVMRQIERVAGEVRRLATSSVPDAARRGAAGTMGSLRDGVGSLFPGAIGEAIRGRGADDDDTSVGPGPRGARAGREATSIGAAASQSLAGLVTVQAESAAARAVAAWRADAIGGQALENHTNQLSHASPDFSDRADRELAEWRRDLVTLVRDLGEPRLRNAKLLSVGINFLAGALMLVVFAGTGGVLLGTEVVIAGGVAAAAHKLLVHVLGRETVAHLARRSRALLDERIAGLLDDEARRFHDRAADLASDDDLAARIAPMVALLADAGDR